MSSTTPDDRERPVTRREFRAALLMVCAALAATALAIFLLLVLEIRG
ncbi:hypothetical protein [Streptomyces solincola]|nr:hypothetical protein [Streptomyces solincola]